MRMKSRRTLAVLLSMILLLALAPSGFAVDLEAKNTVTVTLAQPESDYAKDLKGTRIHADFYLLAPAVRYAPPYENVDSYTYTVPDKGTAFYELLDKLTKELNEAEVPEAPPVQEAVFHQFEPYAQAFAEIVLSRGYSSPPAATGDLVVDQTAITVQDLTAGLYLLIIRGDGLEKSENPETGYVKRTQQAAGEEGAEGNSVLSTRVVTDRNEYLFEPQLLTVPTKVDKTSGEQQYNTAYGEWENLLMIYAKSTQVPKNGDLKIIKNLTHAGPDSVTFVFEVKWQEKKGSENVDKAKYVSLTFDGKSQMEEYILAKTIPIGTTVTVTEVHSGLAYSIVGDNTKTATIVVPSPDAPDGSSGNQATEIAEVSFTNDHSGPGGGYGVLNRFTVTSLTETGTANFEWTKLPDSRG